MILPDGYSDVPAGKIAGVVTHLEMTERPALPPIPPGAWTLRQRRAPRPRLVSRSLSPRRRGVAVVLAASHAPTKNSPRVCIIRWSKPMHLVA